MYLKRLEMLGFKSFADRTRIEFAPGLMAIVGPNGCGKSNIADAVRWVLGEQSPKAMRGAKMEDVIFSGTDQQKPMGMAEVSLTLASCEAVLGTEFHEVTVTRRVYRSGEGEYLINKTPCRLKDIHRLFMDTGIGTNSYSLMEQGRIDRILSSRPEDRRAVFEEASGITKFKADKREAIRKLEQTENNLLRLADILREVKRQIISLQRQAGKAKRYKALQEQLRALDLHFARGRLNALDAEIAALGARHAALAEREEAMSADVGDLEQRVETARRELSTLEQEAEKTREDLAETQAELDRTQEGVEIGQARIQELTEISERDGREAETARRAIEEQRAQRDAIARQYDETLALRADADRDLAEKTAILKRHEDEIDAAQQSLHNLRNESLSVEARLARGQEELAEMDARDRASTIRRERLAAEQVDLGRQLERLEGRGAAMAARIDEIRLDVERKTAAEQELRGRQRDRAAAASDLRKALAGRREAVAAREALREVLGRAEADAEGFPGGARLLLDPSAGLGGAASGVLGTLAQHLEIDEGYRAAAEAALRPWLDAVVVADGASARRILREIERRRAGSARLLAADAAADATAPSGDGPGEPLAARVRGRGALGARIAALLRRVRVFERADDWPPDAAPDAVWVTRDGLLAAGAGVYEYWMAEAHETNPLARRQALDTIERERGELRAAIAADEAALRAVESDDAALHRLIDDARAALEAARHDLAVCEGEQQVFARDAELSRRRVETVGDELDALQSQTQGSTERRAALLAEMDAARGRLTEIRQALGQKTDELRALEQQRSRWIAQATEARVLAADQRRAVEHLDQRRAAQDSRIAELEAFVRERAQGLSSSQSRIEELHRDIAAAKDQVEPLQQEIRLHQDALDALRAQREERERERQERDAALRSWRSQLDAVRQERSQVDVTLAEQRMRRQNVVDRAAGDYHVSDEDIRRAPAPDWGEEGAPADDEALETRVAEFRARLESMGPVNLVAIEEYQELEKRHEFLAQQQGDLVRSKQQLTDLIRRINKTTTELFSETFNKVNAHFEEMFAKLFGGGTAKLVLVDEGDVLESGIEIIARPPGKKLQTVSLLSGGERTMTAVALLFALYLVKPSPFCVLDELDAALDDSNIGRFVKVVQDFLEKSQFVVITHNRQTIAAAHALFGVTMQRQGVSRIVSVRFNAEGRPEPDAAEETAAAEAPVGPSPALADEAVPAAPEPAAPA